MLKGVERQLDHPLPGILSLLDVDFKTKGLSWAGNIYQKWDNLRVDNMFIQKPCEYVDAFGECVREVLDEVAKDWLNHSNNCLEGPVSDLSLEHDVIAELCKLSTMGIDENHTNANSPHFIKLEALASFMEDLNCDASRHVNLDSNEKVLTSVEFTRSGNSDGAGEVSKDVSDRVISLSYVSGVHPSPEDALLSEAHEIKGGSTPPAVSGSSQDFDSEELFVSHDMVDSDIELIHNYEDAEVEDWVDCTEEHELSLVLHKMCKDMSYKKKLEHTFRSTVCSLKDREQVDISSGGNIVGIQNGVGISASSISAEEFDSNVGSTHNSFESDWELL